MLIGKERRRNRIKEIGTLPINLASTYYVKYILAIILLYYIGYISLPLFRFNGM